jgi:general secretion pathway protein K
MDIRRTANLIARDQAWLYTKAAETWSKAILARDQEDNETDSMKDIWAQRLPPLDIPGGVMVGFMEDLQGRLNINNLIDGKKLDPQAVSRFQRLLEVLELPKELAQAVADWLDEDVEATAPEGAEDDYYLGLEQAYMAGNRNMVNISELRLVKGFDQPTFQRIAPFMTALPERTSINVNTASAEILASLSPEINLDLAQNLVKQRDEEPFEKTQDFTGHDLLKDIELDAQGLDVSSQYFILYTDTRIINARASLESLILREQGDKLRVLQRSQRVAGLERNSKEKDSEKNAVTDR